MSLAKFFCTLACSALLGVSTMSGQTIISATSSGNTGAGPNGIAATPSELLFTQPFCSGMQTRGIYNENLAAGTSTLIATIPETGVCAENYLAISTGQGGFTAGDTFATGTSTTNTTMSEVFKNGSTPFVNPLPNSKGHAGITFDTIGTFGNNLIVTLQGSVEGYNAAGAATFTYNIPSGSLYSLEGAAVAPLSYAACPGCLFVTATLASNINNPNPTGQGVIYYVHPGTPSGSFLLPWSSTPGSEPEGLVFVGTNLSCGLTGPNSTQYSYFVSGYATDHDNPTTTTGKILAYTPVQLNPYEGQILVPDEGGVISAFSAPNTYTTFSSTAYQLEGSTIVNCTANGCPATFGYWKHHPFPSSMFVGGVANIGCTSYTEQQLLTVLTTSNAGGNAVTILGHQLIAAIANYDAGGTQTADASAAIAQAVALLCANHVNLTSSFVASSSTLGQTMVNLANTLDAYNSSAPSCEGSGLSAILKNSTKKAS